MTGPKGSTVGIAAAALLLLLAPASAGAGQVTVPADIGIGPAAYWITGPVADDQPIHYGLKISIEAVIDQKTIRENERAIPQEYRKQARNVSELRYSPSIFIPDALFISPKIENTAIYGVTWRPIGLNVPLVSSGVRLTVGAGLLITYALLYSDVLPTTHFLRPGIDLGTELEIPFSESFLVSLGWSSGFYLPEKMGKFLEIEPLEDSMWHLGQAYLKLHFRFPYTTRI